jgi:hypothetical protein
MRPLGFSIDLILPAALCPELHSATNRNKYRESSWGKGVKGGLRMRERISAIYEPMVQKNL